MRTANERMQGEMNTLIRNSRRIYEQQIDPYFDFIGVTYVDNYPEEEAILEDCRVFFRTGLCDWYGNYNDFYKDALKCVSIYHDKLGGADGYQKKQDYDSYEISTAKMDYEFMAIIGKICLELLKYLETAHKARVLIKSRQEVSERRKGISERMEHAHEYPRNLRPPMSQGRLYGEETRAPRRRAAPKKRTPAVKVNVRKMF